MVHITVNITVKAVKYIFGVIIRPEEFKKCAVQLALAPGLTAFKRHFLLTNARTICHVTDFSKQTQIDWIMAADALTRSTSKACKKDQQELWSPWIQWVIRHVRLQPEIFIIIYHTPAAEISINLQSLLWLEQRCALGWSWKALTSFCC